MAFLSLFNAQRYLDLYPDVKAEVDAGRLTAHGHFQQHGMIEGRSPLSLFDSGFYLRHNPDVAAAVAVGAANAIQHFAQFGHSEPRSITPALNLATYLLANPDVAIAVADGQTTALDHLAYYGLAEGRDMGNGIVLSMFHHDPVFMKALENKDYDAALARVDAVAPFISSFEPPAGWVPDPDMPIPVDFVPPPGMQLQVPPGIRIPDGVTLPETFLPAWPEPAPEPPYTPDPSPGDGGVPPTEPEPEPEPEFTVTVDGEGWLVVGKDHGAVHVTLSDDETHLVFTPQNGGPVTAPRPGDTEDRKLAVDGALTASSETLSDYVVKGSGDVHITGSDLSQTITLQTTGENSITPGKGGDRILLGNGVDTIVVGGGSPQVIHSPSSVTFTIDDESIQQAALFSMTIGEIKVVDLDVSGSETREELAAKLREGLRAEYPENTVGDITVEVKDNAIIVSNAAGHVISNAKIEDSGSTSQNIALPVKFQTSLPEWIEWARTTETYETINLEFSMHYRDTNGQTEEIETYLYFNAFEVSDYTEIHESITDYLAPTLKQILPSGNNIAITHNSGPDYYALFITSPDILEAQLKLSYNYLDSSDNTNIAQYYDTATARQYNIPPKSIGPTNVKNADISVAIPSDSYYTQESDADNMDTIVGFSTGTDKLQLPDAVIMTSLQAGSGTLSNGVLSIPNAENLVIRDLLSLAFDAIGTQTVTVAVHHGTDTLVIQGDGVAGAQSSDIVLLLQGVTVTDLGEILSA